MRRSSLPYTQTRTKSALLSLPNEYIAASSILPVSVLYAIVAVSAIRPMSGEIIMAPSAANSMEIASMKKFLYTSGSSALSGTGRIRNDEAVSCPVAAYILTEANIIRTR